MPQWYPQDGGSSEPWVEQPDSGELWHDALTEAAILASQQIEIDKGITLAARDEAVLARDGAISAVAGFSTLVTNSTNSFNTLSTNATASFTALSTASINTVNAAVTAAQAAQTAAETARTAAQTARTGAETARTGAETAQTAAAGSATGAAGSAATATTQATTATTKASNAATSATAAQAAQTAAETAQAAAAASAATAASFASSFEAGEIQLFARNTPPTGRLAANGAAVAVATYGRLATAIYCGDAANPTASWGYKCTNPASPATTRSTTGAYIVLPDVRGEFLRGWDNGRGVDSGRSLWAYQAELVGPHGHTVTNGALSGGVTLSSGVVTGTATHANSSVTGTVSVNGTTGGQSAGHTHSDYYQYENQTVTVPTGSNYNMPFGEVGTTTTTGAQSNDHTHGVSIAATMSLSHPNATINHTLSVGTATTHNLSSNVTVAATATTENRPRNAAFLACITY